MVVAPPITTLPPPTTPAAAKSPSADPTAPALPGDHGGNTLVETSWVS